MEQRWSLLARSHEFAKRVARLIGAERKQD
jgi:hypothetical protein